MKRQIREYVEIDSHRSLDEVIEELIRVRDALPDGSEAEVRMRGDDFFGRHLCVQAVPVEILARDLAVTEHFP